MRVSVALHRQDPGQDGNQRDFESRCRGYNRQHIELEELADGRGAFSFEGLAFPEITHDPGDVFTHASLGLCENCAEIVGGSIITAFPITPGIPGDVGVIPTISAAGIVFAEKLAAIKELAATARNP